MPSTSVHMLLMERVQSVIQGMDLVDVADAQVVIRAVVVDRDMGALVIGNGMIIIAPIGAETQDGGTNERDDIGYPVGVAIVGTANQNLTTYIDKWLLWRQRIFRKFRVQRQNTVGDDVWNCRVEPGVIVDPSAFMDQQLFVSGLVLRFINREPRG